jgi:hypothetical protein
MSDLTDQRILNETKERSYTFVGSKSGLKGEIDSEDDAGGFEDYPEETRPDDYDSDKDGLPNWWEDIIGTNPHSDAEDFSEANLLDAEGYTALEHYLDFMAQPHLFMTPGSSTTISLSKLFAGYTYNPVFTVVNESPAIAATVNNYVLNIVAHKEKSLNSVILKVQDATGDSCERRLCIALTDHQTVTAISQRALNKNNQDPHFYDLFGRRVLSPTKPGIYIRDGIKVVIR